MTRYSRASLPFHTAVTEKPSLRMARRAIFWLIALSSANSMCTSPRLTEDSGDTGSICLNDAFWTVSPLGKLLTDLRRRKGIVGGCFKTSGACTGEGRLLPPGVRGLVLEPLRDCDGSGGATVFCRRSVT